MLEKMTASTYFKQLAINIGHWLFLDGYNIDKVYVHHAT